MNHAARCAAIVTTALVVLPRAGAAQSTTASAEQAGAGSEAVSLGYDESTPADCPSEEEFRAEVTKLTGKARFTSEPGSRPIRIYLDRRGNQVVGRLVTGESKNQSSREVRGKDCREVSSALAIAVALTIDPDALGAEPAIPPGPEPPPKPPEPPPEATKPPPPPLPPPRKPQPKPAPPPPRVLWGLGAGLTIENAWAPQLHPGIHGFAMLGVGEQLRINLGATYFPTREDDGVAFDALFGRGDLAWSVAVLGVLRPFVSLGYEGGVVYSAGSGLETTVEATRPWHSLNAGLGLRFETDALFFQLGGSLLVPFSRQQYLISDPDGNTTRFYETSRFGLRQETSLGVFL